MSRRGPRRRRWAAGQLDSWLGRVGRRSRRECDGRSDSSCHVGGIVPGRQIQPQGTLADASPGPPPGRALAAGGHGRERRGGGPKFDDRLLGARRVASDAITGRSPVATRASPGEAVLRRPPRAAPASPRSPVTGSHRRQRTPIASTSRRLASAPSPRWSSASASARLARRSGAVRRPRQPADGRVVVHVGRSAAATRKLASRSAAVFPSSPGRDGARRRRIDRPSTDRRPCPLWPTATNGSAGVVSCSAQPGLQRGGDGGRLGLAGPAGDAVEPVEEGRVEQERRPLGHHLTAYMRTLGAGRQAMPPCRPAPPRGGLHGPLRAQPAHPRPDRPAADASARPAARQMINHRGPEFAALLGRIIDGMKPYFGTTSDVAILSCAGHRRARGRGRQHAVARRPGPRRVASARSATGSPRSPRPTARTSRSSTSSGAGRPTRTEVRERPPTRRARLQGRPADPQRDVDRRDEPDRRAGRGVREAAPDALILVDSVSGLGAVPFEMDAWGVDVVVTGSQKAWMAAPGLAMVAASERAWAAMETATMPRFYLDLRKHRDAACRRRDARGRPRSPSLYQVDEGLRLMHAEGTAAVFARHEACAAAARGGPRGARLRAVRRPALRVEDGHRRVDPRGPRLEGVQRRAQAAAASSSPAARAS